LNTSRIGRLQSRKSSGFGLDHGALDASKTDADFLIATPNDDGTAGDMMDTYAGAVGSK
jgi:hypothetical protein